MLTRNKKLTLIISFGSILLLLFVASIAFGHGWEKSNRMNMHDMQSWNSQQLAKYSLNADQMDKVNTIMDDSYNDMMPSRRELSSLRMEMQEYSGRSNADPDEIESYRNQIRSLEDKIGNLRLRANKQVNNILSDNQRDYFGASYDWCDIGLDYEGTNRMHMGINWRNCDMHMSGNNNQYSNSGNGCCW